MRSRGSQYPGSEAGSAWAGSGDVNNTQRVSIHQTSLMSLALRGSLHPLSSSSLPLLHLSIYSLMPQTFSHSLCVASSPPHVSRSIYLLLSLPSPSLIFPQAIICSPCITTSGPAGRTCESVRLCLGNEHVHALTASFSPPPPLGSCQSSTYFLSKTPAHPFCPNMFLLLLSNNMWRIFQLFIKQCQSFLGAGDAVNYSTITWVIMQREQGKEP